MLLEILLLEPPFPRASSRRILQVHVVQHHLFVIIGFVARLTEKYQHLYKKENRIHRHQKANATEDADSICIMIVNSSRILYSLSFLFQVQA